MPGGFSRAKFTGGSSAYKTPAGGRGALYPHPSQHKAGSLQVKKAAGVDAPTAFSACRLPHYALWWVGVQRTPAARMAFLSVYGHISRICSADALASFAQPKRSLQPASGGAAMRTVLQPVTHRLPALLLLP